MFYLFYLPKKVNRALIFLLFNFIYILYFLIYDNVEYYFSKYCLFFCILVRRLNYVKEKRPT